MFALVYTIDGRTERHLLTTGDTTVGRSPICDLAIADPSISRRHARFRVHGDHCLLTDLGGRNGTFLNGEAVAEAQAEPGDTVTLGRFPLVLQRATESMPALSEHQPAPDGPATICRRVTQPSADPWRPVADGGRLLALIASLADRLVPCLSSREVLSAIADVVFVTIAADRVFLFTAAVDGGGPITTVSRTRGGRDADATSISRLLVERVLEERLAILSMDALPNSHTPTGADASAFPRRSFIATPICHAQQVLGVLYADAAEDAPLSASDLDVLYALSHYAGAALEHGRQLDALRGPSPGAADAS